MQVSCITFPLSLLINHYPISPTPILTKNTSFQKNHHLNQDLELVPLYSKSQLKAVSNNNDI